MGKQYSQLGSDQFLACKLEHEVFWKTLTIAPYLLIESYRGHAVEFCEVGDVTRIVATRCSPGPESF